MKLYHYTTIETFSKIWVSKQLRFSESKNTNDLFEKRKTWEFVCGILPNEGEKDVMEAFNTFGKKFSDILAKYRQISFSLDYKNLRGCYSSMMWGQYAHNENGVCIEFDSEKMYFPPNVFKSKVKYTYDVPKIRFDKESAFIDESYMRGFVKNNKNTIFFTKHKHWEHENEFRLVSNCYDYLSIEGAITKIYVFDPNNINTRVVEHVVNNEVPICFLYISHLYGKREISCYDLKSKREIEKRVAEDPDCYSKKISMKDLLY